jgi:branched-chain amino acid transport system permease protein
VLYELLIPQFLNSLQLSMLLFLMAIGLSVVFGLMSYLNLSHGTIYMFSAYAAVSISQLTGSYWIALVVAPLMATAIGLSLYQVLLKKGASAGHLTQVILTLGVVYIGYDLVRIFYGDLSLDVPVPPVLSGAVSIFGSPYPAYRLFVIFVGIAVQIVLYIGLERTRIGAVVRAGVDDRVTVETLGINVNLVFLSVFAIGTFLAGLAGVIAAPIFSVYPGMDATIIITVLIVVIVGGLGSLRGAIVGSLLVGFADTFGKILFPSFSMMLIYFIMAFVLVLRPTGLLPAGRLS